jgi:hypothetical protein
MRSRTPLIASGLVALLLMGCDNPNRNATGESKAPVAPAVASAATSKPTISQEVAHMFIGITSDARNRPNVNALDTFAVAYDWPKTPPNMNAMLNAKVGYVGKVDGQMVMAGSDGTNDILSISMRDQFAPDDILRELKDVYTLKSRASDTSDGQRIEIFTMFDGDKAVGLLTLSYGVASAIKGTGTLAYISIDRARKEMPDLKD